VGPGNGPAMLRGSDLNRRVRIEEDRGTSNASTGVRTEDWQELCTRWSLLELAGVSPHFAELRKRHPTAAWALALRYDATTATIGPLHRVVWTSGSQGFAILGAAFDPDGRRREIHVPLSERFPIVAVQ